MSVMFSSIGGPIMLPSQPTKTVWPPSAAYEKLAMKISSGYSPRRLDIFEDD